MTAGAALGSGVLTTSLKALTQPVLLGFWGGLYFLPSVLKLRSFCSCLTHVRRPIVLVVQAETQQQEGQSWNSTEMAFGENVPL